MGDLSNDKLRLSILAALSIAAAAPAMAQNATPSAATTASNTTTAATAAGSDDSLDEIVITASAGDKTQLRSSLQVTNISSDLVLDMAPRSTAATLRLIPGMSVTDQAGGGG